MSQDEIENLDFLAGHPVDGADRRGLRSAQLGRVHADRTRPSRRDRLDRIVHGVTDDAARSVPVADDAKTAM